MNQFTYPSSVKTDTEKMLWKVLIVSFFSLIGCVICLYAFAQTVKPAISIDLYRTKQLSIDQITEKYGNDIQAFVEMTSNRDNLNSPQTVQRAGELMMKITDGIHKMGDFAYVNVVPIMYQGNGGIHVTVDLVDKADKSRMMPFYSRPTETFADPDHLIQKWMAYQKLGFDVGFKNKGLGYKTCPAFHCIFGFDRPEFKPYGEVFNTLVPKDQAQLVTILQKDKDDEKRAAAAFLLAHIKNGETLIRVLTPAMFDPSADVRNNAMRVLASTLGRVKDDHFPIQHVLLFVDSPYLTDRNKSLYMLSSLVDQPKYAKYTAQHAGRLLMQELMMLQPNVHQLAYEILFKISGKRYAERDYTAWQKWLDDNSKLTSDSKE